MIFYTVSPPCTVLYCTLLARAAAGDERNEVEARMQADPALLPILQALTDIKAEDLVEVRHSDGSA